MRWPSRREHGGNGGPPGAAPAAAEDAVHASPGVAALFAGVEPDGTRRILDLGPAVGASLAVYSPYAASVRFVDLLSGAETGQGAEPQEQVLGTGAIEAALPPGADPYDLVLLWDVLDHLDREESATLMRRLDACSRPGTRLFAMVAVGNTAPERPRRFELVDTGQVRSRAVAAGERPHQGLAPAEVERRLAPFRVTRSVILRHGVREYVAVRRSDDEAVVRAAGEAEVRGGGRVIGGVRSRRVAEAVVAAAAEEWHRSGTSPG